MQFDVSSGPDGMPIIFVLIAVLGIAGAVISMLMAARRRKEMREWCARHGLNFDAGRDHSYDSRYPFVCLDKGSNRYAYNICSGQWKSHRIVSFDYHYETYSRDSKGRRQTHHHRFSASVIHTALPLKPLLIRPESFLDAVTDFFGANDIDFESIEFSKRFYVKAPDPRWAYDVIHQRMMEFLLASPCFTIELEPGLVFVRERGCFSISEREASLEVATGMLERLPDYLLRQLQGHAATPGFAPSLHPTPNG